MTTDLSNHQQEVVFSLFDQLEELSIRYVVLRRYELLPDSVPGSQQKELDIDILVESDKFEDVVSIAESLGFGFNISNKTMANRYHTLVRRIKNPQETVQILKESPEKVEQAMGIKFPRWVSPSQKINPYKFTDDSEKHYYVMRGNNMKLDLKPHLAHETPMALKGRSKRIRLHPHVEKQMLNRRVKNGQLYHPSPPDELVHLLTHVIFEYKGEISEYYEQRIHDITNLVLENELYESQFKELLSLVYFNADSKVYEFCEQRKFKNMFSELKQFSDY